MRTLPEQMVSVTLISLDEADVVVTTTEMFLLESMELAEYNSTGRIRVINHLGVTRSFPLYSDFINGTPRAESIAFKSNEGDDYQELVQSIQFADITKALENLGSEVSAKFKEMIHHCPAESNNTLWEALQNDVLGQKS